MDEFEKWLAEYMEEPERLLQYDKTPGVRMFLRGKLMALKSVSAQYRSMTCKIMWDGDYHICDKCGSKEIYEPSYNYCPNCGRKVVE